jgi:ribosomal protein L37AE/L43A
VADRANDEISQLAGQGNLQALSVYLNRHLIPHGAHVKLKSKDDALHILIVVMRESENPELLNSTQALLIQLSPANVQRVKIYTQVLGQKQAILRLKFFLTAASNDNKKESSSTLNPSRPPQSKSSYPSAAHPGTDQSAPLSYPVAQPERISSSFIPSGSEGSSSKASDSKGKGRRYSVAEFLSQATNIEDLRVLHDHPFFTNTCPRCRHQFREAISPPIYWDCPKCGWTDDLAAVMPQAKIRGNSTQTSVTESKRLGDYLVEAGLLTESQIEVALADQLTTGLRFGEVLVRRGWVKEDTIEYLMQKVIVPERAGLNQNASFLASSRNLLKALLLEQPLAEMSSNPLFKDSNAPVMNSPTQPEPSNPFPQSVPTASSKLPNERETLILPDLDMNEYLKDS